MRKFFGAVALVSCAIGLTPPAIAADMKDAEIKELISGKTIYLDIAGGGSSTGQTGSAAIYYDANGTALFKTPGGAIWHAPWMIKDNQVCNEWKEATANACSRYDKVGDTITIFNVASGKPRGKIVKTAAGNPEGIKP